MASPDLIQIEVGLRADKAKADAQEMTRSMVGSLAELNEGVDAVGAKFDAVFAAGAVAALATAGRAIVAFIGDSVRAYDEAAAAERRAVEGLRLHGVVSDDAVAKLKNFDDELQRSIGIDGDKALSLQGYMASLGVLPENLETITKMAIGFSQAFGMDLPEASRLAVKAYEGNVEALKKQGIEFKSAGDAVAFGVEHFKLAAQASESVTTRVAAAGHAFGDLQEAVGGLVSTTGVLQAFFDKAAATAGLVRDQVEGITNAIKMLRSAGDDVAMKAAATAMERKQPGSSMGPAFDPAAQARADAEQAALDDAKLEAMNNQAMEKLEKGMKAYLEHERAAAKAAADELARHTREMERIVEENNRLAEEAHRKRIARDSESLALEAEAEQKRAAFLRHRQDQRAELAAHDDELRMAQIERERQFWGQIADIGAQGVATWIGGMAAGIANGDNILDDAGKLTGGLLVQAGQSAVALGLTAIAAATVGSLIPFLAPVTGGPAGIGAGFALVGAGTAAIIAGSALGAASGGGSSGGGGGGPGASSARPTAAGTPSVPSGFSDRPESQRPINNTIIVQVSGIVQGTKRELGRAIRDAINDANTLLPGGTR